MANAQVELLRIYKLLTGLLHQITTYYPRKKNSKLSIGIKYIKVLDINNYFHQYRIHLKDRHIFTITSHYGLKRLIMVIIGFQNNPAYVQRYMDTLLRPFQRFARYYINNKVIFLKNRRGIYKIALPNLFVIPGKEY